MKRNYSSADVMKYLAELNSSSMAKAVKAVAVETNRLKRQKAARDQTDG